mmetsp:Transcript_31048/g.68761  ORF Transcript_31048/g.68761 Transcript_31048/m.68761 type:complete len:224 (-) Transcript_31048:747-1418(-)
MSSSSTTTSPRVPPTVTTTVIITALVIGKTSLPSQYWSIGISRSRTAPDWSLPTPKARIVIGPTATAAAATAATRWCGSRQGSGGCATADVEHIIPTKVTQPRGTFVANAALVQSGDTLTGFGVAFSATTAAVTAATAITTTAVRLIPGIDPVGRIGTDSTTVPSSRHAPTTNSNVATTSIPTAGTAVVTGSITKCRRRRWGQQTRQEVNQTPVRRPATAAAA